MIDFGHRFFSRPSTVAFPYPLMRVTTEATSERIKRIEFDSQRSSRPRCFFLFILPVLINLTLRCGPCHLRTRIDSKCTDYDEYRVCDSREG